MREKYSCRIDIPVHYQFSAIKQRAGEVFEYLHDELLVERRAEDKLGNGTMTKWEIGSRTLLHFSF
jgi:hypothetical protein